MVTWYGTGGNDTYTGTYNNDWLYGLGGDDTIDGGLGTDFIYGGDGDDTIHGSFGDDTIDGGSGADKLYGDDGNDIIHGGSENDTIEGYTGNDTIYGDDGADEINGGNGNDYLDGGSGNDTFVLNASAGWDTYVGGSDYDTIEVKEISAFVNFTAIQITSLDGIEKIENNSDKPAYLYANSLDVSGLDALVDVTEFRGNSANNVLTAHTVHLDGPDTDTGMVMEGYAGDDYLTGSSLGDDIRGGTGSDVLRGLAGNDIISGGAGNDSLYGDADGVTGDDRFYFSSNDDNDTIYDFEDGADTIDLTGTTVTDIYGVTIAQNGYDTLLSFDNTTVLLCNVSASAIDSSDFNFHV